MTVDNEQPKPKPQPIPMVSSINMGEPKFERLPDHPPKDELESGHPPVWHGHGPHGHGPPPHVRKFMKRKMKRVCCCLFFLILVNLMVAAYIAKKVAFISYVLSPESEMKYMPGGYHPFCADLCVDLCASDKDFSIDCDVSDCVTSCGTHFESSMDGDMMQMDDESDEQVSFEGDMEEDEHVGQVEDLDVGMDEVDEEEETTERHFPK